MCLSNALKRRASPPCDLNNTGHHLFKIYYILYYNLRCSLLAIGYYTASLNFHFKRLTINHHLLLHSDNKRDLLVPHNLLTFTLREKRLASIQHLLSSTLIVWYSIISLNFPFEGLTIIHHLLLHSYKLRNIQMYIISSILRGC